MNATTPVEIPARHRAMTLGIRPPSHRWAFPFKEVSESRELVYFFVRRDIKIRYRQTAIVERKPRSST
jgi:hypothetical protein